ncbi:26S protease regulatory subunit [Haloarcula sp. K1]|uniref:ATP-binding protein n=1 Tax=Haloarcula sp. K1 TaxID=1622207 RepID=UPI0007BC370A|nr:ATP-binding protein [Haloarcula sp. K1]KZX46244.1 AAA family ATPase [Haloarcula sp. K1]
MSLSLLLFAIVYIWMTLTWFIYADRVEQPPIKRTAVQIVSLVALASMTNSPALLLAPVALSAGSHLHLDLWEPVHTGIVAGAVGAGIITLHGMSLGYAPTEWITGDGSAQTYAIAGIAMTVATTATHIYGNPIRSVLVQSGVSSPTARASRTSELPYGTVYNDVVSNSNPSQSNVGDSDATSETEEEASTNSPAESDSNSETSSQSHNHSIRPARSDPEPSEQTDEQEADAHDGNAEPSDQKNAGPQPADEHSQEAADNSEEETVRPEVVLDENGKKVEEEPKMEEFAYPWEEPPDIRFADIGGYNDVKEELTSQVINPLRSDSESYARFDVQPSRGLLFHGPPGTGKTLFARALANALDRPFVELTQADLTHEHINKSPQLIKRLFEEAQHLGGVIFIDEAEQLLGNRTQGENAHAEDNKVTNMFLSALTKEDQDFILLLTTNQRDKMDEAVLRPGRVDSEFEIGLPDVEARTKILKLTVLEVPHKLTEAHVAELAERTEGWSGADLDAVTNQAKLLAAERSASYLRWEDVKEAYNEFVSKT